MKDWNSQEKINKIIYEDWAPNFPIASQKVVSSEQANTCHVILINNQYILKLPKNKRSNFHIERESIVLEELNRMNLSLVPKIIAKSNTSDIEDHQWLISHYINGEAKPKLSVAEQSQSIEPLVHFLKTLQQQNSLINLPPSQSTYLRGGRLKERNKVTKEMIEKNNLKVSLQLVERVWDAALGAEDPEIQKQLIHGDLHPANIILGDQAIQGIIDFGCSSLGDRSCDLMVGWTIYDAPHRKIFFNALSATLQEIQRARGWALTFALGAIQDFPTTITGEIGRHTLHRLLTEVD